MKTFLFGCGFLCAVTGWITQAHWLYLPLWIAFAGYVIVSGCEKRDRENELGK